VSVRVFLIGAGPGDPDLLTIKAHRLIQSAEVILHDSLVDPRILSLAADHAELVDVGKRCGKHSATQTTINQLLVGYARTGQIVVRLKGGDPMIFGRATEELESLAAANVRCEIIPGITAATAAAASLQRSLTQRGIARSLHFLTGHGAEGGLPAHDWVSLNRAGGTLVIYMGSQTIAGLASHLIEAGMSPTMPAIAVENASLPGQVVTVATISTLPNRLGNPRGPTILLIGEAMASEDQFTAMAAQLVVG
jgi:uroporphyrin-III C-methyltransferase/precorrin-2 dehydrogenase/sirohydrochlorin ferrochelatase/uroporphyrin-III C-methyltransferase